MASLLLEATRSRGRLAGPLQVIKLVICSQVIGLFSELIHALCCASYWGVHQLAGRPPLQEVVAKQMPAVPYCMTLSLMLSFIVAY